MRKVIFITLLALFMNVMAVDVLAQKQITWVRGADLTLPRGGYFAAWYDGGLWVAGGSYWKDGKKLWTGETSVYRPKEKTWSKSVDLPKSFGYGVTAVIGKDLYILGGVDGDGVANKEIFRLRDGKWTKVGESPRVFIYAAFSVIGAKIYVFGGATNPGDVTTATDLTRVYDTGTGKWSSLDPIPGVPRQTFSAAAVGKNIFVFGGVTQKSGEKFYNLDEVLRFDTAHGKWSKLKAMPVAMRAHWASAVGDSIYLLGGYSDSGVDTVYRYSPASDNYELVSTLPQPLMDTKFVYHDGAFYGAGGEDKLVSRFSGLVIGSVSK